MRRNPVGLPSPYGCLAAALTASLLGSAGVAVAAPYTLPADRITLWTPGLMTRGGIPSGSWPLCNPTPLSPGGGDDSAAINHAIATCAPGTVVQLGPGTFLMGQGQYVAITKGIVLRGAGAGLTILKNPLNTPATTSNQQPQDPTPVVIVGRGRWVNPDGDSRCQGPTAYDAAFMRRLAADGAKAAMSVSVGNAAIFHKGQYVLLDETSGAGWRSETLDRAHKVWASADFGVTFRQHKPTIQFVDDGFATGVTPTAANNFAASGTGSDAACWFSRQDRPQNEIKQIAAVSGNTVTFTSPLHKSYRAAQYAELTTFTGNNRPLLTAGIEKLTLVGGGDGAMQFQNTAYSWARNIEVKTWYGAGVTIDGAFRTELRDSYIHDAAWAEPGGAGYGISLAGGSSEVLIENNIVMKANKMLVVRSSGAGSVVGYNYMDAGYIATNEAWIEVGLNASHMVGSHHVLFEGNRGFNIDSDDTHGNSTALTFFRNVVTSLRRPFHSGYTGNAVDDLHGADHAPKRAAGAMRHSYWMNFVGNILGLKGVTTAANGYADERSAAGDWGPAIWLLGWNDIAPYKNDPRVAATAIRDGNWDWLKGKQTWLNGTAGQLPASLYLAAKPAFFGSNPWPWVDPVTGRTALLPAKARLDAGTPNIVP